MKKVLIITYYWPPSGGAGVQRWVRFVKHLRSFGWEPVIYAPESPSYALEDISLVNEIPCDVKVYKRKIREVNNLFAKLSPKRVRKDNKLYNLQQQKGSNRSFFQKLVWFIRGNFFIPDARFLWIKPSIRFLNPILEKEGFDAVVSTGPPHSLHLIAENLKKKHDIHWIADFRDPWTSMDYMDDMFLTEFAKKKHARLEKKVIMNADEVVVVGKTMFNEFKGNYNVESKIIYNGYEKKADDASTPIELDEKFTIVHIGSFLKNRNCNDLWEQLATLCKDNVLFKERLEIRLIGNVAPNVLESIVNFGLNNNLNKIDYIPFEETQKYLFGAQVLLLPIDRIENAAFVLTGKLFEYLKSKRPVLLLAPSYGDAADIIEQCNAGYCCDFDDGKAIKDSLLTMFNLYLEKKNNVNSVNIERFSGYELTRKMAEVLQGNKKD
ncbi:MAG: glycosyl transferase family 1 [Crocinitomicaceae bacterium]|nr:glycosyl transferase family 1 [Crocinitomicaceae bacterium]